MTDLTLYAKPGCPYCQKVLSTLEALELDHETIEVPVARSERTTVERLSGQTGVPMLVDEKNGVEGMAESDEIVAYLENQYGA